MNLPLDCIDTIFKSCDILTKLGFKMSCKQLYFRYMTTHRPPIFSVDASGISKNHFDMIISGYHESTFRIPKDGTADIDNNRYSVITKNRTHGRGWEFSIFVIDKNVDILEVDKRIIRFGKGVGELIHKIADKLRSQFELATI